MEWLNYHHLFYFWTIVREGGISAAAERLHVGRPSISMQLKSLEGFIGTPLFVRHGRRLELTETGRLVHSYADEIFETGRELMDAVRGRPTGKPLVLRVGIADVMAKTVAARILQPALDFDDELSLACSEDHPNQLFARLAVHELDLVLSDVPLPPSLDVRAYNHRIGESTMTLFATARRVRSLKRNFPQSLEGEAFLMPAPSTAVRGVLDHWFEENEVRPLIVAEFEDSALLKVFGRDGRGIFPAPTIVTDEIVERYGVRPLAELEEVRERFYAITPERKIKHPAVAGIVEQAKRELFT